MLFLEANTNIDMETLMITVPIFETKFSTTKEMLLIFVFSISLITLQANDDKKLNEK